MLDPTYQEEGRRGREQGYKGKGEREREESEWRKLTTAGGRLNRVAAAAERASIPTWRK